jgi:hypothetical protein
MLQFHKLNLTKVYLKKTLRFIIGQYGLHSKTDDTNYIQISSTSFHQRVLYTAYEKVYNFNNPNENKSFLRIDTAENC